MEIFRHELEQNLSIRNAAELEALKDSMEKIKSSLKEPSVKVFQVQAGIYIVHSDAKFFEFIAQKDAFLSPFPLFFPS